MRIEPASGAGQKNHLFAADPRKKIFVAPGKTHHFMGKHRSASKHLIVLVNQAIDAHDDRIAEDPAGYLRDFLGGNCPDFHKCRGNIPSMIEYTRTPANPIL